MCVVYYRIENTYVSYKKIYIEFIFKGSVCVSTSTVYNTSDLNVNDKSLELVIEPDDNETNNFPSSDVSSHSQLYYLH